MNKYKEIYDEFLNSYTRGETSGVEAGEVIVKLAQCFCEINMQLGKVETAMNKEHQHIISQEDEQTGKPMTATKAETLLKATQEHAVYTEVKKHLQNVEQCINAVKALQRGLTNEYSHVGS